jgi:hypothetical protein
MDIWSEEIGLDPATTVKAFWARVDGFGLPRIKESLARYYLNSAIGTIAANKERFAKVLSRESFSLLDLEQADPRSSGNGFFAGTKLGVKATPEQADIGRKHVAELTADDMKILARSAWLHADGAISLLGKIVLCEEIRRVNPDFIFTPIENLADIGPAHPRQGTGAAPT